MPSDFETSAGGFKVLAIRNVVLMIAPHVDDLPSVVDELAVKIQGAHRKSGVILVPSADQTPIGRRFAGPSLTSRGITLHRVKEDDLQAYGRRLASTIDSRALRSRSRIDNLRPRARQTPVPA